MENYVREDVLQIMNEENLEDYLNNTYEYLSQCLNGVISGDIGRFYKYYKSFFETTPPERYSKLYVIICNLLKSTLKNIEEIYMFIELDNETKVMECSREINKKILQIIASFLAILKTTYANESNDFYIQMIQNDFPNIISINC